MESEGLEFGVQGLVQNQGFVQSQVYRGVGTLGVAAVVVRQWKDGVWAGKAWQFCSIPLRVWLARIQPPSRADCFETLLSYCLTVLLRCIARLHTVPYGCGVDTHR